VTCDPQDDTVDLFQSLQAGIAAELSQTNYNTDDWRLFHESLLYVVDYEDRLYKSLGADEKWNMEQRMLETLNSVEEAYD